MKAALFFMMKTVSIYLFIFLSTLYSVQSQTITDSSTKPVVIQGYSVEQTPASVSTVKPMLNQPDFSLVPAMNTMAGVRMEERSPGSYRLAIRGSVLRSPFGVRNIKVYLNEFPLTDAGGNTYLNSLDPSSIQSIEIRKGPYGNLYGANTGGVLKIQSFDKTDSTKVQTGISSGSYGLFHEHIKLQYKGPKQFLTLFQGYQRSDGYRANSALQRHYGQADYSLQYTHKNKFSATVFYSDLNYETPGGLTLAQAQQNPRAARSSGALPGAEQQKAGVQNTLIFGGLSHEAYIGQRFRHVLSVFTSHAAFQNPFITNYEVRSETTFGLRTYIEARSLRSGFIRYAWNLGTEWQKTNSGIKNYGNRNGTRDTIQTADDINARQYFIFSQLSLQIGSRWIAEAGISLNQFLYSYRSVLTNTPSDWSHSDLSAQLLPRIAVSYTIFAPLLWRASVSKGYSPPALAEIKPSGSVMNLQLQAEYGWNYETGFRFKQTRFMIDAAVFYYQLHQAIVRRLDANSIEYYTNAGKTNQYGLETQVSIAVVKPTETGIIRRMDIGNSVTAYLFSFSDYKNAAADYSGNRITGVPRTTIVSSLFTGFAKGFYLYIQHTHTSRIALNDANTVFSTPYHLLQAKAGWKRTLHKRYGLDIYAGADNILNAFYSLGNDLNAVGNRYYNPAPAGNFYAGVQVMF